jgi:predicted hotdog family 3-hydroxylacyl-ACP dehydratase
VPGVTKGRLDHAAIASRIPHDGRMCLLHEVAAWDANSIDCRARSHRDPANPLRSRSQLSAVHGIEYAAQAMALHGALLGGDDAAAPRPGYIGAVRALELHAARLDDVAEDLAVRAERLIGDASHVLYSFSIRAGPRLLLEGRISVALGIAA